MKELKLLSDRRRSIVGRRGCTSWRTLQDPYIWPECEPYVVLSPRCDDLLACPIRAARTTLSGVSEREWTVDDHLRGRDRAVVQLYERLVELVKACGPFELSVSKTAITFKGSRRGFAGAKPKNLWLDGYFDLQRQVKDPRIRRASPYTKRLFVHQFRVSTLDQLDEEFADWVREAYEVGEGRHL